VSTRQFTIVHWPRSFQHSSSSRPRVCHCLEERNGGTDTRGPHNHMGAYEI